jgi:hypothetical protein
MPKGRRKGEKNPERPIIQVNDNYRIVLDANCLILQIGESGKWKENKYYTSWSSILEKILNSEIDKGISKKQKMEIEELRDIFINAKNTVIEIGKKLQ